MPSQNVLLPLFDFAFERGFASPKSISEGDKNKMLLWFLTASFNGTYSSSPNYKIQEDLDIIRQGGKRFPLDKMLAAMKRRPPHLEGIARVDVMENAYYNVLRGRTGKEYLMLLSVLLHTNRATDWASRPVVCEQASVHHIFPREFLKEAGETRDEMINCLANLTYISPSVNSEISDQPPVDYLGVYADADISVLDGHFIPSNRKLWQYEKYEDFLDARLKLIWAKTRELVERLS
jgi:hypothetical protein